MDQMKRRDFVGQVAGIAGIVGLGSAMALTPKTAEAQVPNASRLILPLTGTITNIATGIVTPVTGTLAITQFVSQAGNIVANGIATLTGGGTTTVVPITNLPVTIPTSTCDVLNLTLGPLDLNLLGLQIHLDRVVLNITANPAGGLLGQLLCALAGGGPLQQLVTQLNRLLALL